MSINAIKSKVLLLFLTITVVVVLSMTLLMKFGFNQGFTQYKKSLEKELNDRMVDSLENHFRDQQSWNMFVEDPRAWHELVFKSATETMDIEQSAQNNKPKRKNKRNQESRPHKGPPPRRNQDRPPPDRNIQLRRVLPAYTLYDQQQQKVIGPSDWNHSNSQKISIVQQGKTVGYLVYKTKPKADRQQDKQFNQNIWRVLMMVCGVMLLVALLFTLPVTNYLIKPIKALNLATQKAAAGDYSVRTSIGRKDELGQLGQNFNVLIDTLLSNTDIHKKMMADISHELRTPVAVLLAEIEAIQDGIHVADEKNLNLLHQQINALKYLINDLHQLSLTDLGSMQYQMQATDINLILSGVIQTVSLAADKKKLTVSESMASSTLWVLGDSNRLHQLFNNILNNAVNYTDEGGTIVVSTREDDNGQDCVIEIQDSAPGLLPHEIEQMFDRLYRKETSRNKKLGGSGLGLAITKNIVEAHHGTIEAKASSLGGINITVRLPKHV